MKPIPKEVGTVRMEDGAEIYFEIRGEGPPLVFVYGIACLINHWHHQVEHFSKNYKVYAFDLRGHHKSSTGHMKNLSVDGLAHDLIELLKSWNVQSAHVVGHSFGVPVLLTAYNLEPQLFRSLTLINGFAKNPIKGMFGVNLVEPFFNFAKKSITAYPDLWRWGWKKAVDHPVSMILSGLAGGFNLNVTQMKDIEIYARGVAAMPLDVFVPLFESLMNYDGSSHLKEILCPTLVISGEKDSVTPESFQKDLHDQIQGSRWIKIPYGSHCCQLDFPDYINLKIEQFIKEFELAIDPHLQQDE